MVRRSIRWVLPALIVLVWLGAGGSLGSYNGKLGEVQQNDTAAFLPDSAESTKVSGLERQFDTERSLPLVLLWESKGPIDVQTQSLVTQRVGQATALAQKAHAMAGQASPVIRSSDGQALEAVIPVRPDLGDQLSTLVAALRALPSVPSTTAHVTGPGALFADFADGFSGIDGMLLLVAFGIVLLILIAVYRSPVLPLLVLVAAGMALSVSAATIYFLAKHGVITVNGQSQGVAAILVVGAATDYGLLLVARFREELRLLESPAAAMKVALRQSWAPIVASGGTVILGVLCLLLSDLSSNRGLGPVAVVSVLSAMTAALTFLPAALVLLGRAAFWPYRPRFGDAAVKETGWHRVAATVGRRPARVLVWTLIGLGIAASFSLTLNARGISFTDALRSGSDATRGQVALERHFTAGSSSPALVITPEAHWNQVATVASNVSGVAAVAPFTGSSAPTAQTGQGDTAPKVVDGAVLLDVTLSEAPDSDRALDTITDLRKAVHAVDSHTLVGGSTAESLDARDTATRDLWVIAPSALLVIGLVLALLLRSIVAPLLLVGSVGVSVAATLGISSLMFDHVFGFASTDPSVLLISFVFLVALGVDYNIFLMSRAREEAARHGTRRGIVEALGVTGGVITSAGMVLAATFGALAVLPLVNLNETAFIVGFGVLLDTFVVRALTVPAAVYLLGERTWWPSRLSRHTATDAPEAAEIKADAEPGHA